MVCKFWQKAILGAGLMLDPLRLGYSVIKPDKRNFKVCNERGVVTDHNLIELDQEIEEGEKNIICEG